MDVSNLLTSAGLGKYALGAAAAGYVVSHLVALGLIPAPKATGVTAWRAYGLLWKVLNVVGGANYGAATTAVQKAVSDLEAAAKITAAVCLLVLGVTLSACAGGQVVVEGQLFCAKATANGPLTVALANAAGVPVVVTGMASAIVASDCAAIDAVPVSPPVVAVPTVAAVLPAG